MVQKGRKRMDNKDILKKIKNIDGIGIILYTLVRYYVTQLALVRFCFVFCVGECGRYPVFIPGTLWVYYSIRHTCMKAYTKRITIKFTRQMNFFVRQASSFRIRSQIVTMSKISDFIIFQYYCMYLDIILYVQDTRISDEVYRVRIISCEMIYLILFVGWVCLWAWYIFSLRMRVRMVPTDRIIRIM